MALYSGSDRRPSRKESLLGGLWFGPKIWGRPSFQAKGKGQRAMAVSTGYGVYIMSNISVLTPPCCWAGPGSAKQAEEPTSGGGGQANSRKRANDSPCVFGPLYRQRGGHAKSNRPGANFRGRGPSSGKQAGEGGV